MQLTDTPIMILKEQVGRLKSNKWLHLNDTGDFPPFWTKEQIVQKVEELDKKIKEFENTILFLKENSTTC